MDPNGSAAITLQDGILSLIFLPMPQIVPPVPAPQTIASIFPSH